jgi:hypothetical protein
VSFAERRGAVVGWLTLALAVAALAFADTLGFGFVADARFLIRDNRYLDSWRWLVPTLTHDYFWSSSGAAIPYWRPLTKLGWLVTAQWFNHSARAFHAVELAWILVVVAGVFALARRLGASAAWAGAAAIVFALHPALIEPGCLLMAQSDVQALACTLWALLAWLAWRDGRRPAWLLALAHAVAVALALGAKESTIVLPAVLTGWSLISQPRRMLTTAPAWILAALYLVTRQRFLHATPTAPLAPLRIFSSFGVYAAGLLPLRIETAVHDLSFAEARAPLTLAGSALAWLALGGGLVLTIRRRSANTLGLLLLGSFSLLPVLMGPMPHVPGISGKYALADRWLITAAAATTIGLTILFSRLPRRGQGLAAGALALWALGSLALVPTTHHFYASDETLLTLEELRYQETPERFRTVEDRCRAIERRTAVATLSGDVATLLGLVQDAPPACPPTTSTRFNLLAALVRAHRYDDARPMVEPLLAHFDLDRRYHAPLLYLSGVTLLHSGEPARAEALLLAAQREGLADCALWARLAEAAAAQHHDADVATRKSAFAACANQPR